MGRQPSADRWLASRTFHPKPPRLETHFHKPHCASHFLICFFVPPATRTRYNHRAWVVKSKESERRPVAGSAKFSLSIPALVEALVVDHSILVATQAFLCNIYPCASVYVSGTLSTPFGSQSKSARRLGLCNGPKVKRTQSQLATQHLLDLLLVEQKYFPETCLDYDSTIHVD